MKQKEIISALIKKAGSIKDLSIRTDTTITRIYEWKNEKHQIRYNKLLSMCKDLKIELKELLNN